MLGTLTFFTGPMACGKTLELVRHLQIYSEQRVPTICLRPATDTRGENVHSRSGMSYNGLTIDPADITAIEAVIQDHQVIGIDEAQFFDIAIVPALHAALRNGKTIMLSGLDTDFRGEIFPIATALFALPETIVERTRAVCAVCRQHNATRTQRLKNGEPVRRDEPVVAVEGAEITVSYEPRCLEHHVVL